MAEQEIEFLRACLDLQGTMETAVKQVEDLLWQCQLLEWPDSKRLTFSDVVHTWIDDDRRVERNIALCNQFNAGVWYECGRKQDGTYSWRGYRYGFKPEAYVSGFGKY
jgi:hypothetical protein